MANKDLVQAVAGIDVGSNAMRCAIASVNRQGDYEIVASQREAVRLGQDVFGSGNISEETTEKAVEAFERFRAAMDQHGVRLSRAVATSALREAHNREFFVDRVAQETGIELEVIGGEEEARLVCTAVGSKIDLRGKRAILIDIGGGSVEVTYVKDGDIVSTESVAMGTVRLLQRMRNGSDDAQFHRRVREYADITRIWLEQTVGGQKLDFFVGTGGNVEALAGLRALVSSNGASTSSKAGNGNGVSSLSAGDLDAIVDRLLDSTYEQRMQEFKMRPDRADVIVPASIVLQTLLSQCRVAALSVPHVGLKDGLLLDLARESVEHKKDLHRDQVIGAALQLGRKYAFDEQHGERVRSLAVSLFDQMTSLHHLGEDSRLLLEVAALLHDIGNFVNVSAHHKHTAYLLSASPIIGLSEVQRNIVANVARYHRKSPPTVKHDPYRVLQPRDRLVVSKLASIVRLADAMDAEHAGKVSGVSVEFKRPRLQLRLHGEGDMLLEKWSLGRKAPLLEEVFGVKLSVETP